MTAKRTLPFAALACVALLAAAPLMAGEAPAGAGDAVDVGSRLELFVDKHLIGEMRSAEIVLNRLEQAPASPQPGLEAGYTTVLRDGDLFRMYGRGYMVPGAYWKNVGKEAGTLNEITLYAESRDGIHWTRPNLGLFKIDAIDERLLKYAKENNVEPTIEQGNIVMAGEFSVSHNFTPLIDARPCAAAEARYKAVGGTAYDKALEEKYGPCGMHAFTSADGIHWKRLRKEPIIPGAWGKFDSQNLVFWSPMEKRYVAYFRYFAGGRRAIRRSTSEDFLRWTDPVDVDANLPEEQLYTNNVHPYFRAPHIYVAPATRYIDGQRPNTFVIFMTSRDGVHFDRTFGQEVFKETFGGNRTNYLAWTNGAQTGPKELSFYDHQQNRFTLRLDGFGSIRAGADGGEMVTRPLRFRGAALHINARTAEGGQVRVELQDADGRPLPGFALADAVPFTGDEIAHAASWKAGRDLAPLAGKPIRVRFVLKAADLYAIRFE